MSINIISLPPLQPISNVPPATADCCYRYTGRRFSSSYRNAPISPIAADAYCPIHRLARTNIVTVHALNVTLRLFVPLLGLTDSQFNDSETVQVKSPVPVLEMLKLLELLVVPKSIELLETESEGMPFLEALTEIQFCYLRYC